MDASTISPPQPAVQARWGRRLRAGLTLALSLSTLGLNGLAQDGEGRPDQVFRQNSRNGRVTTITGTIVENTLEGTKLVRDGKDQTIDNIEVVNIVWGQVPPSFADGKVFAGRGDWENAVAKYRVAATDASARPVVQAAARLASAESLLEWGAKDPTRFDECVQECTEFLSTYASDRAVPRAEWIKARATWLSGKPADAAAAFREVYDKGAEGSAPGYERELCLDAGLSAAWAYLEAGDSATAREILRGVDRIASEYAGSLEAGTESLKARLEGMVAVARVGEGFAILGAGQADQAVTFFSSRSEDSNLPAIARATATVGLGDASLANGQKRAAQIAYAKASAMVYGDRDLAARALLGLAESTAQLADGGGGGLVKKYLEQLADHYGDTPPARAARTKLGR